MTPRDESTAGAEPSRRGRYGADGREGGWPDGPGVVTFPDGTRVRGRALRRPTPPGPQPQLAIALLGRPPQRRPWPVRWVRWPDFRLPADDADLADALRQAHALAREGARVELCCGGGTGRTGTALACLAQLAGVDADDAVDWTREHYAPRAVETPWQRRYVRAFTTRRGA